MISCFTRGARRAAGQSGWGTFAYGKRCFTAARGAAALARQEDRPAQILHLGSSSRPSQSCCANAIQSGISMTSIRSHSPSLRAFSTPPPACCRNGRAARILRAVPEITYSTRPYPSAGSAYETGIVSGGLELRGACAGLYHYDAGGHALVVIGVSAQQLQARFRRQPSLPWTHPVRRRS